MRTRPRPRERRTSKAHPLPDARKQVIFWQFAVYDGPSQMIVLCRPDGALHVQRAAEPEAVRVDLGGVRLEGLVPGLEVVPARHLGGDLQLPVFLAVLLGSGRPFLED